MNNIQLSNSEISELQELKIALDEAATVAIVNQDGLITYVNDRGLKQLGYKKEEIIGLHFTNIYLIELREFAHQLWQTINNGNIWKGEIQNKRQDGQPQWMDTTIYPFVNAQNKAYKYLSIQFDITDKKLIQYKANSLESQYYNLVNDFEDGIFQTTLTSEITLMNPACEEVIGYSFDECKGKSFLQFTNPADKEENQKLFKDLVTGTTQRLKHIGEFTRKDNTIIWVEIIAKLLFDSKKRPIGLSGTIRNITEQVNAQNELATQRKFYEQILKNLQADVVVLDGKQNTLFINPAARRDNKDHLPWMLASTEYDTSKSTSERNQELIEFRNTYFDDAIKQRRSREWEEVAEVGGTKKYVLRRLTPIFNNQHEFMMMVVYGFDITKRKKAQEDERELGNMLNAIISNIPVIAFKIDKDEKFAYVDGMALKRLNLTKEDLLDKSVSLLNYELHQHLPTVAKPVNTVEIHTKTSDDEGITMRNYLFIDPQYKEEILGFALDITETIANEKKLKEAIAIAREAAIIKQRFLANMSHEIRTPMNGIMGMIDLIGKTPLAPQQEKFLKIMKRSSENLLTIVNDILDVEKIELGKMDIERVPFNIKDTVENVVNLLQGKAEEKRNKLELVPFQPKTAINIGDGFRLNQILMNLINNALKFTDNGTVTLSITNLNETDNESTYLFAIKDTGIGISKEMQESIFEEFTQEYSSTARQYGGTGLGLTICKNLVEIQGGRIWAESDGKTGSTFSFILTYQKGSIADLPPTIDIPISNYKILTGIKILLAEDNEVNTLYATTILKEWGANVIVAENGSIAVQKIQENDVDVVLMDIQMPIMNGLEATQNIRKLPDLKKAQIPIIACTANALKGDYEQYMASGMTAYISKPFNETELFQVVYQLAPQSFKDRPIQENNPKLTEQRVEEKSSKMTEQQTENASNISKQKLYSLDLLNVTAGGNKDFIQKMVALFVNTFPEYMQSLHDAIKQENWKEVKFYAHKMKSTIDLLGISSLKAEIRQLEHDAEQLQNLAKLPALENKIRLVLETVLIQIKDEL